MLSRVFFSLVVFSGLVNCVAAGTLSLTGAPATYSPGESFSFEVHLTDVAGLASYNIELSAEGTDLGDTSIFTPSAIAPTAGYVFTTSDSFVANSNVPFDGTHRVVLSDFQTDSLDVVGGVNDHIATVFVQPRGELQGDLTFSFVSEGLFLDGSTFTPVDGFDEIRNSLSDQAITITAVPEPATFFAAIVALLITLPVISACRIKA